MRATALLGGLVLGLGCGAGGASGPAQSSEPTTAEPAADKTADGSPVPEVIETFEPGPGSMPEPKNWWQAEDSCPEGAGLTGAAPPEGKALYCKRGGRRHGRFAVWRADGTMREQGEYERGVRHGVWSWFGRDGEPLGRSAFEHGTGLLLEFSKSDKKRSSLHYQAGKPHGLWQRWHKTGALAESSHYDHGVLHGAYIKGHANGKRLTEGRYQRGKKHGA